MKSVRKLTLRREALNVLVPDELLRIAGGPKVMSAAAVHTCDLQCIVDDLTNQIIVPASNDTTCTPTEVNCN